MRFATALLTEAEIEARWREADTSGERTFSPANTESRDDADWPALPSEDRVLFAARLLTERIRSDLGDLQPDLLVLFYSSHFTPDAAPLAAQLRYGLQPRTMIGLSAESLLVDDTELEHQPAICALAGYLPGTQITPFALSARHLSEWATILSDPVLFAEAIGVTSPPKAFLVLIDPFSVPIDATGDLDTGLLRAFSAFYPDVPVAGGVASGGTYPGSNMLICDDLARSEGFVGVAIAGDVDVDVIVSQGCRPIGRAHLVTATRQSTIVSLDGERPLDIVQQMVEGLDATDRQLLQTGGLYVGRTARRIVDTAEPLGRGDFLIRGVLGADSKSGGLITGDSVEPGDVIQFHVRDAKTAEEDLEISLAPQAFSDTPAGALLFTCNGRGTRLYDRPNGDVSIIQAALAPAGRPIRLAGIFAAGEIGPISGRAHLHGHTASLMLFRPAGGKS